MKKLSKSETIGNKRFRINIIEEISETHYSGCKTSRVTVDNKHKRILFVSVKEPRNIQRIRRLHRTYNTQDLRNLVLRPGTILGDCVQNNNNKSFICWTIPTPTFKVEKRHVLQRSQGSKKFGENGMKPKRK